MAVIKKPTKAELEAAVNKKTPDVIGRGLKVLFCGINPGLYTAWSGHHFAHPGNRFWKALYESGFTERQYKPFEDALLLKKEIGITNLVARASRKASEINRSEFIKGGEILAEKISIYAPSIVAFIGIISYKTAYGKREAFPGFQSEIINGSRIYLIPSTSGLNASYPYPAILDYFRELMEKGFLKNS